MTPRPRVRDRGLGAFVTKTTGNRVVISSVLCRAKPASLSLLGGVHFILDLPLLKSPVLGIGALALNKVLPKGPGPTYPCSELGSASIPYSFDRNGVAQLRVPGHYLHYGNATWQTACTLRYCGVTHQEGIEVRSGR